VSSDRPDIPPDRALDGLHHVTAITADAQRNLDFYVGLLGLRLVKRSIVQSQPPNLRAYHLFYGDELGRPGADISFLVHPRLPRGHAGSGMVHQVIWRLGSIEAVDFWEQRLIEAGLIPHRGQDTLAFEDPDGLVNELRRVAGSPDEPLSGVHPEIPPGLALQGLHAVRAYGDIEEGTGLDELLGFSPAGEVRGPHRRGLYLPGDPPATRAMKGAGTVHHVAWAIADSSYEWWIERLRGAGVELVEVADRYYFRSIYFHIPGGVLFELATRGPGFGIDEPLATLGSELSIPPAYASLRAELEANLAPLQNPRDHWPAVASSSL
jgi:glyoxalase family protein